MGLTEIKTAEEYVLRKLLEAEKENEKLLEDISSMDKIIDAKKRANVALCNEIEARDDIIYFLLKNAEFSNNEQYKTLGQSIMIHYGTIYEDDYPEMFKKLKEYMEKEDCE